MKRRQDFEDADAQPAQRPPPIPPFTWMGAYSPLLIVPLLLLIAVAMFAPDNVLDVWPLAKTFTDFMGSKLSWIGNHAQSTSYPQVALLIACLTVVLLAWTTCVFFVQSAVNYPTLLARQKQYRTVTWPLALGAVLIGIPLFVFCTAFAFALPGDPSFAKGFTTSSRAGLLVVCFGLSYAGGLVIGGTPMMFRALIDLDLRKGN
jgi:hypothetical protein